MSFMTYIFLKRRLKLIIFCGGWLLTAERRVKLYDFIDNYRIFSLEQLHVLRNVQGHPFVYRFADTDKSRYRCGQDDGC